MGLPWLSLADRSLAAGFDVLTQPSIGVGSCSFDQPGSGWGGSGWGGWVMLQSPMLWPLYVILLVVGALAAFSKIRLTYVVEGLVGLALALLGVLTTLTQSNLFEFLLFVGLVDLIGVLTSTIGATLLGVLLFMPLLAQHLSGEGDAEEKSLHMKTRLVGFQLPLGWAGAYAAGWTFYGHLIAMI